MGRSDRRTFLKQVGVLGAAVAAGPGLFLGTKKSFGATADIYVATGDDYYQNTIKVVEALGGMKKFVGPNAKVGLLVNSPFSNPGTFASPDVAVAVVEMCFDAGAKEVRLLKQGHRGYWEKGRVSPKRGNVISRLTAMDGTYRDVTIDKGLSLKKAEVARDLFFSDVFINVPVTKNHEGTHFSSALKNMMGLCPHSTCRYFHTGAGGSGWYGNVAHLSQCIADLNLVRKPDLVVCDSTQILASNGPFGPGTVLNPKQVSAGTDPVLMDAYSASLLGLNPADIAMIQNAAEHGLGEKDLSKARIEKV
jgi:uncharacterized protein (DUF362 family)